MEKNLLSALLNQPKPVKEKKTVRNIFQSKFLLWLDESGIDKIAKTFLKLLLCFIGGTILFWPVESLELVKIAFKFREYFIPKFISLSLVIWNGKSLLSLSVRILLGIGDGIRTPRKRVEFDTFKTVAGVPVEKILDHLVNVGTFKLKDVCALGITKRNFEKLSAKLSALEIIHKDKNQNNCFVVSEKFDVQELATFLLDRRTLDEILDEIRLNRIEINSPATAPEFKSRSIA